MTTVLAIIAFLFFVLLIIVTAMRPIRSEVSVFELRRRDKAGDTDAARLLMREAAAGDIQTVLRIIAALFLVICVLLSVASFGWLIGSLIAVVIVLEYGALARIGGVQRLAGRLYIAIEPWLFRFVESASGILRFVRFQDESSSPSGVFSKDELLEVVRTSKGVLSADEARRVEQGLYFSEKRVSEVMTPRSVVDTVAKGELLGPLTLDVLYKTGHSRLPVIDSYIDHVVGILYVQDLLVVGEKKTPTAAEAMDSKVFYIREDQTLQHALGAFLKTRHHLFVVVNEYRETVGVVSLEDVIEALIGTKINDEFDAHDDLRKVAERNPAANNQPKNRTDV
jgi:CBS domain containing-hemolysin-like protein